MLPTDMLGGLPPPPGLPPLGSLPPPPGLPMEGLPPPPGFPGMPGGMPPPMDGNALAALLMQQQQHQTAAAAGLAAALGRPPPPAPGADGGGSGGGYNDPAQMTSQQLSQHQQVTQAAQREEAARMAKQNRDAKMKEQAADQAQADKLRCHLHKKANNKCKFCKRYTDFLKDLENRDAQRSSGAKSGGPGSGSSSREVLEIMNPKTFGFSPLLQTHIVESAHFKALTSLGNLDQLVDEMNQFADGIEPYMMNSNTTPSALFCCLYRLFTMGLQAQQLRYIVEYMDNPYVRCAGFLFVRFGLQPDALWHWLGDYVLDDEIVRPTKDSDMYTTVGEFVEGLLTQDKYYSTVLPRLPMSTKRQLETKLAPVVQCRKRTRANKGLLEVYRKEGVKVEANKDGDWRRGTTIELLENVPSRIKVLVRWEDDTEEEIHLGRVILADSKYTNYIPKKPRDRSRSRSRDGVDWARTKGRSDKELVDEMRRADRDRAVCASGKEYAKKPVGYKAACALPREQGAASHRLMEEETFVPMKSSRRRSPSPGSKEQEFRKAPSAEHQARMQQLFEKYGMSKTSEAGGARPDIEGPDVMRLG